MLISMQNIGRVYRKGSTEILAARHIDLAIREGEFLAIMGQSGSGKSTLLHILGCLDRPSTGSYQLDGIEVGTLSDPQLSLIRNQKIGFVFQSFHLLPQHTVFQNIEAPLFYQNSNATPFPFHFQSTEREQYVKDIAEHVGLGGRLHHRPSELSGGEMQRVAIARALITQPRVILADEPTGNLDSQTGQEIMNILQALHEQDHTIIIVTHERSIATCTERIIYLKDGRIDREEKTLRPPPPAPRTPPTAIRNSQSATRPPHHPLLPSLFHLVPSVCRTAIKGVFLHKLRSFLSVLGIVFGIGAIIAMLGIGAGARQEILEQIELLGTSNILIKAIESSEEQILTGRERLSQGLTQGDVERISRISPFIDAIAPLRTLPLSVQYQQEMLQADIVGTSREYRRSGHLPLNHGRFFTSADEQEMRRVCVLGDDVRQALFAFRNPIGQMIKIRSDWFRIIGTLDNKTMVQNTIPSLQPVNINRQIYIPLSTSSVFVSSEQSQRIHEISVRVDAPDHVDEVARLIRTVLSRLHHGADDYEVLVPRELLRQSQQAQEVFNIVMGSIAGISLLVGGIGIMNIMLATVTERTREIGIRRAIGADKKMILLQFLIETLVLTLVGGCLGVLLGIGGAYAITIFAGWHTLISVQTISIAFGISAVIGLVFGLYPASQGANMNPIAALRYE
ncbi:hypothetical protein CSA56_10020 [candidate division KSB3 bacterium]|uniref:ABC transporter domain-containing protein n=1 Tax=candidate division KSB3 bacterium TaxID=2044937 RepID=A0A2G6KG99_9BACT|nr:MAG: hypothetical protein CSA56_10020 [candidate division KSB3 bacterium]